MFPNDIDLAPSFRSVKTKSSIFSDGGIVVALLESLTIQERP
jgi:hypothetical protein